MSQIVLALDTSTPRLSAALLRCAADGRLSVLAQREADSPSVTSTMVPVVFDEMLADAQLSLADVDLFVTGLGPGLFTGVRVAVATMKTLAYARRRPLIGAESLEAMALQASRRLPQAAPLLCSALDARKGEVYWAVHRVANDWVETVSPPRASTRAIMIDELARQALPVTLFGTGAAGVESSERMTVAPSPATPSAFDVAALALHRHSGARFDHAAVLALEPFYLRPPEAEVARRQREQASAIRQPV